jgi:hypothetical protein
MKTDLHPSEYFILRNSEGLIFCKGSYERWDGSDLRDIKLYKSFRRAREKSMTFRTYAEVTKVSISIFLSLMQCEKGFLSSISNREELIYEKHSDNTSKIRIK